MGNSGAHVSGANYGKCVYFEVTHDVFYGGDSELRGERILLKPRKVIRLHQVTKSFTAEGKSQPVLHIPSKEIVKGEQVALVGESGSGKTTLLNLLSGLLVADSGEIEVAGEILTNLSEHQRDSFRAKNCGCVFQSFHLLDGFSAKENVELGACFARKKNNDNKSAALKLLAAVGLSHRVGHYPSQLSAGQQARVALARALVNKPQVILADEPTGSLDASNRDAVLELLTTTCRDNEITLVCVTHDDGVAARMDRIVRMEDLQ